MCVALARRMSGFRRKGCKWSSDLVRMAMAQERRAFAESKQKKDGSSA